MGISGAPAQVLEGSTTNDYFGNSVASAGDVNGDGFGDLVVGANAAAPSGRVQAGTASVFHGSAMGIPMAPTRVLEGTTANDSFGVSVASAGETAFGYSVASAGDVRRHQRGQSIESRVRAMLDALGPSTATVGAWSPPSTTSRRNPS